MSGFGGLEAWFVYGGAALATFVAWYALCARIGSVTVRDVLRVVVFATLVTPAPVPGYDGHLAPAWLVALFEAFLQREGDPLPAATLLLIAIVGLLALVAAWRYFRSGPPQLSHRA
jgi:hypothetical protein